MNLISASVTPATWRQHGKAWTEWLPLVGLRRVAICVDSWLEVTVDYLMFLRDSGCSGLGAARRLSGIALHFRLLGWEDVTTAFLGQQALNERLEEELCRS